MEEKERFEIHIYDDVCVALYNNGVLDKSINDTYKLEKLLNQQDREINRLTKMLYTTTKHADKLNEENNKLNKIIKANIISADKVVKENEKLKQYLAEKEKIEYTDTINFVETSEPDIVAKELDRLNEQLAEKDKEIEQLKKFDDLNRNFFAVFRTAFKEPDKVDDLFNTLKTIQEKQDQDKISFAVEQLEVARRRIDRLGYNENKCLNKKDCIEDCLEEIDNQIKQLKEKNNATRKN